MDDVELQQRLTRLADRTAPPPRESLARTVVAQHRAQRRQRIGLTTMVAAVATVVVTSTTLIDGGGASPTSATAMDAAGPEAAVAAPVDVLAGPTRGSLAGDAAFLEAVRQLPWTSEATAGGGVPDAPVVTRRVVFAGDVPGGRWALVVGANNARPAQDDPELQTDLGALSAVAVTWFAGPPGAGPDQLEPVSVPRGVDPQAPVALSDSTTGALVIVTAPGDDVELSLRPEVAADGTTSRSWQSVEARDGLAVVSVPASDTSYAPSLRYRVLRDGEEVVTTGPDGRGRTGWTPPAMPLARLRPAPAPAPGDVMVESEVDHVLGQLGLPVAEVPLTVAWAGDVPGPDDGTARVTVLAATLPSGAVYLSAPYGFAMGTEGYVGGSSCGSQVLPAGAPLEQRTIVLRCDVVDGTAEAETVSSLVVVAPAGTPSARAVDVDGEVLAEFGVTDGVAVVPFPEGTTTVETLAADGSVVGSARPLTYDGLDG